ncbi:hypothetical protein GX441_00950 [bacterium]|nr:hypothetical protein [bacterium]
MVKTRNALSSLITKIGARLLPVLSRWEEQGTLKKTARWTKLFVLGLVLTVAGWLRAQPEPPIATCYDMAIIDPVVVTESSITPNPTNGADSVTVNATAKVYNPGIEGNIISGADVRLVGDTLLVPLRAVDGKFSDTLEAVEGRICIGGLAAETTWVDLTFYTSQAGMFTKQLMLVVTEPDSTEKKGNAGD